MTVKTPICILAYDALEIELVEKFDLPNLKQAEYGKTDISEFNKKATPILWGSFITGENMEPFWDSRKHSATLTKILRDPFLFAQRNISSKATSALKKAANKLGILGKTKAEMFRWNFIGESERETIFDFVEDSVGINIPSYNKTRNPNFGTKDIIEGAVSDSEYWEDVWDCFEKTKEELLNNLNRNLVMAWFWVADRIGHLYRTDMGKMRKTYIKLDELAGEVQEKFDGQIFIIADHGMEPLGEYGDHSKINYGFYSSNRELGLNTPKLVSFYKMIEDLLKGEFDSAKYEEGELVKHEKEEFRGDDEKEIKERLRDLGYFD